MGYRIPGSSNLAEFAAELGARYTMKGQTFCIYSWKIPGYILNYRIYRVLGCIGYSILIQVCIPRVSQGIQDSPTSRNDLFLESTRNWNRAQSYTVFAWSRTSHVRV